MAAWTTLLTPQGQQAIETFRRGDWLLSRSEDDVAGPVQPRQVVEVFVRRGLVFALRVGGRVIRTTAEHPFYVVGRGWLPAGLLAEGDRLCGHDGAEAVVAAVEEAGTVTTVYNVEVADFHTYFVGCAEWGFSVWVHNKDLPTPPGGLRGCFPADTPVHTQGGAKPIQHVRPGDLVWGYDLAAMEWVLRRVAECFVHDFEGDLVLIAVASEGIEATSNHPFWVIEGEGLEQREQPDHLPETPRDARALGRWVDAGNLRAGDMLLLKGDTPARVSQLTNRQVRRQVYNFQVEGVHTYAVGLTGVLVHNKPVESTLPPPKKVALGVGETLEEHASRTGSRPYWTWDLRTETVPPITTRSTEGRAFGRAFSRAVKNADEIHFNLDGLPDLKKAFNDGKAGFKYKQETVLGEGRSGNSMAMQPTLNSQR